jgi:hypothetical protein
MARGWVMRATEAGEKRQLAGPSDCLSGKGKGRTKPFASPPRWLLQPSPTADGSRSPHAYNAMLRELNELHKVVVGVGRRSRSVRVCMRLLEVANSLLECSVTAMLEVEEDEDDDEPESRREQGPS